MIGKWLLMTPPSRVTAPPPHMNGEERRYRPHCFGFSFTIMYFVLPQFGTGSV
jgi:hypothetical protein